KRPGTDAAGLDGLGGTIKKNRSSSMTDLKMEIVGDAHASMVDTTRSVLVVEDGTEDSVVGYDRAYHQVAIPGGQTTGLEPGDVLVRVARSHIRVG
ncbi:MAG: tRNA modifying enzyme, partial [Salinirussus sp.]